MSDNETKPKPESEEGHTKYAVECDPKKPLPADEKRASEGCAGCGGTHEDVAGSEE